MLEELAALSARIGADRRLVQGAGGNSSVKADGVLWVKASGTWLAAAQRQAIFVPLDLARLHRGMAAELADPAAPALLPGNGLRPSIETTLHALLPHRVVLHVHSVNAIAFAVRRDGQALAAQRLQGLRWAWVAYARPGLPLTQAVRAVLTPTPDVLLLGNHGLVVGADSVAAAEALLAEVETRLALPERAAPAPDAAALARLAGEGYRPAAIAAAHWPATDATSCALAQRGSLYPDHVVFLGPAPMRAARPEDVADPPPALLVPGIGTLLRRDIGAGGEEMMACLGLVLARLDHDAPLVTLETAQEAELLDWDAEKYRQSLALKAAS